MRDSTAGGKKPAFYAPGCKINLITILLQSPQSTAAEQLASSSEVDTVSQRGTLADACLQTSVGLEAVELKEEIFFLVISLNLGMMLTLFTTGQVVNKVSLPISLAFLLILCRASAFLSLPHLLPSLHLSLPLFFPSFFPLLLSLSLLLFLHFIVWDSLK